MGGGGGIILLSGIGLVGDLKQDRERGKYSSSYLMV